MRKERVGGVEHAYVCCTRIMLRAEGGCLLWTICRVNSWSLRVSQATILCDIRRILNLYYASLG